MNNSYKKDAFRFVDQTQHAICIVAAEPLCEGHVLILPKKEVQTFSQLTSEEIKDLMNLCEKTALVLEKEYGISPIILKNTGTRISQNHLHVHVIALEQKIRELLYQTNTISQIRPKNSVENMQSIAQKLQRHIH
ncbi:MAG: HIT family protein [Candidatus Woesearchaeota archaeon]